MPDNRNFINDWLNHPFKLFQDLTNSGGFVLLTETLREKTQYRGKHFLQFEKENEHTVLIEAFYIGHSFSIERRE